MEGFGKFCVGFLKLRLGGIKSRCGDVVAALRLFDGAAKSWPPCSAVAFRSAENIKAASVDRWHFRMLNDRMRNMSYNVAIERTVKAWRHRSCGDAPWTV